MISSFHYTVLTIVTIILLVPSTPMSFPQIGSGLYEGLYLEYEFDYVVEASNRNLELLLGDIIQTSSGGNLDQLFFSRIEVLTITNQDVTLSMEQIDQNGQIYETTKTYTFSELSRDFPFVMSTDSSFGDSIKTPIPGVPFLDFIDTRIVEVNGVPIEMMVFAAEQDFSESGETGRVGFILTYDKQTGFLTSFVIAIDYVGSEGTGIALIGMRVIEIGTTIPIFDPPTCSFDEHLENGICVKNSVIPPPTCPTGKYLENGICVSNVVTQPDPTDNTGAIIVITIIIVVIGVAIGVAFSRRNKSTISVSNNTQQYASAASSNSKFCYNCQTPALAHNKFCKKCGKPI